MNPDLVSVIIPTRNRAVYLAQALDSVYAQHYPNLEILVIDDGSTDSTRELLANHQQVTYLHQPQHGVSAARNLGIRHAKGAFIVFLDDDDLWLPGKLQQQMEYMRAHTDVVWLCSGFQLVDAQAQPLPRAPIMPSSDITLHEIALFTFLHTSSVMVRKEALDKAGGFPENLRVSEDYHTWARVLMHGKGACLSQTLTCFRQHSHNTKLPFTRLLKANCTVIDLIMASGANGLQGRAIYLENLYRIIGDSLLYKGKYLSYLQFWLWKKL